MGWKNVKEHYRIEHTVHVRDGCVLIGSPYISDLMTITPDGKLTTNRIGLNRDLERIYNEMTDDPDTLRSLISTEDSFENSITVYTFIDYQIVEKQCEETGWPNVTHDGLLMYNNRFSTDLGKVVAWARRDASSGVEAFTRIIKELEESIAAKKEYLKADEDFLARLDRDYPSDPAVTEDDED